MIRRSTLKFLWVTIKHKWFVFVAGLRLGVPLWLLLIHDFSKFGPAEAPAYGRRFYAGGPPKARAAAEDPAFARAWRHHIACNPHHWEYWLDANGEPWTMPVVYVYEMVADWMAACRAYEGRWPTSHDWPWLQANWLRIKLSAGTRDRVRWLLISRALYDIKLDYPDIASVSAQTTGA